MAEQHDPQGLSAAAQAGKVRGAGTRPPRWRARWIETWNKKLHIYAGLFLLWSLWLFSFSGVVLNHPQWLLGRAWEQRQVDTVTRPIEAVAPGDDMDRARELMRQVGVTGEVQRVVLNPQANTFRVQASRPGSNVEITADWAAAVAEIKTTTPGHWAIWGALHTFNGVGEAKQSRNWLLTGLWVLAMDGFCVGLLFLVASSLYMWYQAGRRRPAGLVALGLGVIACGFFVFGMG